MARLRLQDDLLLLQRREGQDRQQPASANGMATRVFGADVLHALQGAARLFTTKTPRDSFRAPRRIVTIALDDFGGEDRRPNTRVAMPSPKLLLAILALASLQQEKIVLQPQARHHLDSAEGMLLALNNGVVDVAVMRDRLGQKIPPEKPSVYRIVGQTLDGPGFALIAHRSVSEQLRGKLRQAAIALNSDPSPLAVQARERLRTSPFLPGKEGSSWPCQRMMDTPASATEPRNPYATATGILKSLMRFSIPPGRSDALRCRSRRRRP